MPLVIVGVALLVIGAGGAWWANTVIAGAAVQFFNQCVVQGYPFGGGPECPGLASTVSTYSGLMWLFILLAVVGFILMLLGLILSETKPMAAAPYMTTAAPPPGGYPTAPAAPAQATMPPTAAYATAPGVVRCPRCGQPARWLPDDYRWYCDNENMYL